MPRAASGVALPPSALGSAGLVRASSAARPWLVRRKTVVEGVLPEAPGVSQPLNPNPAPHCEQPRSGVGYERAAACYSVAPRSQALPQGLERGMTLAHRPSVFGIGRDRSAALGPQRSTAAGRSCEAVGTAAAPQVEGPGLESGSPRCWPGGRAVAPVLAVTSVIDP